jgi:hypothetical protein
MRSKPWRSQNCGVRVTGADFLGFRLAAAPAGGLTASSTTW